MKNQLTDLIVERLQEARKDLKDQFSFKHPIKVARHFALDNFLPTELAERVYSDFPHPKKMHMFRSVGELKSKYSHVREISPLLQSLYHAIQDVKVIAEIEEITGIKNQVVDELMPAGGISSLPKGYFINPHIDYSHNRAKTLYRTVNLLYYVSPNWKIENGGYYEVWDERVENRIIIPNLFNRLLVMETNRTSWHSVYPVSSKAPRCCVFNYFFSKDSPEGVEYSHGYGFSLFNPLFKPRPEEKIRRRIVSIRDKLFKW